MSKYAFVFDLDGTLLRNDNTIHPLTLKMLQKRHQNGDILAIATGRGIKKCLDVMQELPFLNYFFTSNSTVMKNLKTNQITVNGNLELDAYEFLKNLAIKENLIMQMDTLEDSYILYDPNKHAHLVDPNRLMDLQSAVLSTWENADQGIYQRKETILQIALRTNEAISEKYLKATKENLGKKYEVVLTNKIFVDINPKNISKALAIEYIKKHHPDTEIFAFGDSSNDYKMLEAADFAITLENATNDLKEIANVIIGDNNTDSIGTFLQGLDKEQDE
ncbi:Cof-type HAD-IIB family hydrolase [Mycoplasmopsis agassizii]|uniref:Cof-type HAD-IIB family hydrolase n=1 Tax=Mycoplasmopsis agassizii TaxID=33922 RepID=A0ABX4H4R2_9BACT|nr:Cof-type HAD-IIB family hydrolase [Mycoplasmopsis agassizii]PAF54872.1 Cof-type HAD-IIB family hydrolase [Mycoplasmopsis agassizii]SMC20043.1 hypothetical protein SAMN02745179_00995 [Mycoplasmopsis agassizii]